MASGGGKMEIKAKIQSKSYSAISDLIALEKVVVRGSKSKDVSTSTEQCYFLYWKINKGDGFLSIAGVGQGQSTYTSMLGFTSYL